LLAKYLLVHGACVQTKLVQVGVVLRRLVTGAEAARAAAVGELGGEPAASEDRDAGLGRVGTRRRAEAGGEPGGGGGGAVEADVEGGGSSSTTAVAPTAAAAARSLCRRSSWRYRLEMVVKLASQCRQRCFFSLECDAICNFRLYGRPVA